MSRVDRIYAAQIALAATLSILSGISDPAVKHQLSVEASEVRRELKELGSC